MKGFFSEPHAPAGVGMLTRTDETAHADARETRASALGPWKAKPTAGG